MPTSPRISDLRRRIVAAAEAAAKLGLVPVGGGVFAGDAPCCARLLTVSFLDRRHAATFASCTASFSLEVGAWYRSPGAPDETPPDDVPRNVACQLRGLLVRDIRQPPPSPDLSPPDRASRDISWVSPAGDELNRVAGSLARVVRRQAPPFYRRFADPRRARRHLFLSRLTGRRPCAPMNIGAPWSPAHTTLLELLRAHARRG